MNQSSYAMIGGQETLLQEVIAQLYLLAPLKFHWHVGGEFEQKIISDGTTSWLYEKDINQVIVQPLASLNLQDTPILLLSADANEISRLFVVEHVLDQKKMSFRLTAKQPDQLLTSIELVFIDKVIDSMKVEDKLSNITVFTFTQVKLSDTLTDGLFEFVIPAGVDVVR